MELLGAGLRAHKQTAYLFLYPNHSRSESNQVLGIIRRGAGPNQRPPTERLPPLIGVPCHRARISSALERSEGTRLIHRRW